jgi:hypothetical protein
MDNDAEGMGLVFILFVGIIAFLCVILTILIIK